MKKFRFSFFYYLVTFGLLAGIVGLSCKKLDLQKITNIKTEEVEISNTIAKAKGTIIDLNDKDHRDYGFCWAKHENPTLQDNVISFGPISESKVFYHTFTSLQINTKYYIRVFIYDGEEVIYGNQVQFIISPTGITVETLNVLVTSYTTVNAKGEIKGVGSIKAENFGHCWSTNPLPTVSDNITSLGSLDHDTLYTSELTALNSATTYYVRAYAIIDTGNVLYGDIISFNISELMVSTDSITITSSSEAVVQGVINSLGFQPVTNHGHCWSTSPGPTTSDAHTSKGPVIQTGPYTSNLTGLDTNITYYVRAYAVNALGTKYGNEKTFLIQPFEISTNSVSLTSDHNADASGTLTIGSYDVSDYGHCWSTTYPPTINDNKTSFGTSSVSGNFMSNLTGLLDNTTYYVRAYAKDGNNIKYGDTLTLVTKNYWTQLSDFLGSGRQDAVSFVIGGKAYFGTGFGAAGILLDFWEYDPVSNYWQQKADYIDTVYGAIGFAIGTKGYVGTGQDPNNIYYNHFFEYDPIANTWTPKANYGGDSISDGIGFAIGNKGYIGTGYNGNYCRNDFWEYDPTINAWTQKAYFIDSVMSAVGFAIDSLGYVGLGYDGTSNFSGFYKYNPVSNNWLPIANFTGSPRIDAVGFAMNNKGFVGLGYNISPGQALNDFWEYSPLTNTWIQKADFSGSARWNAVGFAVGINAYVTTGFDGNYRKDNWKYEPNN